MAQTVKNPPARQVNQVQFLGWEDPLEKGRKSDWGKRGLGTGVWGWAQSVVLGSSVTVHQKTCTMKEAIKKTNRQLTPVRKYNLFAAIASTQDLEKSN